MPSINFEILTSPSNGSVYSMLSEFLIELKLNEAQPKTAFPTVTRQVQKHVQAFSLPEHGTIPSYRHKA